jgi:hypothetical protein
MLGSMLTKEEVDEFMREADMVRMSTILDTFPDQILFIAGWEWEAGL